jgi:hypothetical protein
VAAAGFLAVAGVVHIIRRIREVGDTAAFSGSMLVAFAEPGMSTLFQNSSRICGILAGS